MREMQNKTSLSPIRPPLWARILDQTPMHQKKINWDLYKRLLHCPYPIKSAPQIRQAI